MEINQEEKRLDGHKYAKSLGFTDGQYNEALKLIDSPKTVNQLLVALLAVSSSNNDSNKTTDETFDSSLPINRNNQNNQITSGINNQLYHPASQQQSSINNNSQQKSSAFNLQEQQTTSSSSCYSSTTSFTPPSVSSNNSSLECLQLRKIYIDGSNVARTHGRDRVFSWLGIKLCVDWFYLRQHKVKVFVPQDKCQPSLSVNNIDKQQHINQQAEHVINYLFNIDALIKTPIGCNDDLFIIEAARQNNGIIVSNDLYRDEKRFNDELQNFIHLNRLPYVFVDDLFIPAEDPLGRTGPDLDEFLKETTSSSVGCQNRLNYHHTKLSRTKSNQRYQRYSNSLNANANNNVRSKTALYRTKSHNI